MKVCINDPVIDRKQQNIPWSKVKPGNFFGIGTNVYFKTAGGCVCIGFTDPSFIHPGYSYYPLGDSAGLTSWVGEGQINITKTLVPVNSTGC